MLSISPSGFEREEELRMATATTQDIFPKATVTRQQVEAEQQERLRRGAVSCEIGEDAINWILMTVWPVE